MPKRTPTLKGNDLPPMPKTKPQPIKRLLTWRTISCANGHSVLVGYFPASPLPTVCLSCNSPFISKEENDFPKY